MCKEIEENKDNRILKDSRKLGRNHSKPNYIVLRNWLNIIFMLGALIGVAFYVAGAYFHVNGCLPIGIYIILGSMAFKIVECSIRFFH